MTFKAEHIYKAFDNNPVLSDVNLYASSNDFISITGPSGSGKTTFLSIIASLSSPDSGEVFFNDSKLSSLTDNEISLFRNQNFGFIFQSANMIPYLNVQENIALPFLYAKEQSDIPQQSISSLLTLVGLKDYENKKVNELSGGEQQRVAIVRALIQNPSIIFADEPTGNLDTENTTLVLNILKKISQDKDKIVIIVTHDPLVASYCNKNIQLTKS